MLTLARVHAFLRTFKGWHVYTWARTAHVGHLSTLATTCSAQIVKIVWALRLYEQFMDARGLPMVHAGMGVVAGADVHTCIAVHPAGGGSVGSQLFR